MIATSPVGDDNPSATGVEELQNREAREALGRSLANRPDSSKFSKEFLATDELALHGV